jgi:hypothetical protein
MTPSFVLRSISILFGVAVIAAVVTSVEYPPPNDYNHISLMRHHQPKV